MKKTLVVATALALGLCLPATAAEQFTNDRNSKYDSPVFEEANPGDALAPKETAEEKQARKEQAEADKQAAKEAKAKGEKVEEKKEVVPVRLTAEHCEYDSVSGDFHASGNVVVNQGDETVHSAYVFGNMKTGDVYMDKGGTLYEPKTVMNGQYVHYNFNTKTGEIKEIDGKGQKDYFRAPHAVIEPDKIVVDQGGTTSRCPAVKHVPCLSITAKTFEIYPKEKLVAHDVRVFVKGVHVYSRDIWINRLDGKNENRIMPRIGYDGSTNGWYAKIDAELPLGDKTIANAELKQYSKAGFKPLYTVNHDERNFKLRYMYGWDEDDDVWYKKQNDFRFDYKNHHIIDGLPLSYSAYYSHGLWKRENSKRDSWHTEYAVYLNHDPIYLFNSKNTVLNLTYGKKWVKESRTGDTISSDLYYATLGQKISDNVRTWVGYYREDKTSQLFDIGQPDMAQELRTGIQYAPGNHNVFTIVNRYDVGKGNQYETDYRWLHKFCCWALELNYEKEQHDGDSTFKIKYYFYNL